ncbi:MAG: SCO family protein [Geobacteraceae bacterium]|nr:SCO family protein [Geobacteraceae bacterium]
MKTRYIFRTLALTGVLLGVLLWSECRFPARLSAHSLHEETPATTGLDERLGAKIPLDLTFRDETGRPVRLSDLVTVPTVILPVYYGCTNVCSYLQGGMASALPAVRRKAGADYRVISVSFDETETPAMAARAKRMHLAAMNAPFPADGWRFLTGDPANIRRLTDAAGYRFQRKGRDFLHPVASFVVARDGTIVRYLYGTSFLPKDLTLALLEAQSGTVGATIRKVVGFCFSFDPAGKTYVFKLLRVSATIVFLIAGGFLCYLLLTGRSRRHGAPRHP